MLLPVLLRFNLLFLPCLVAAAVGTGMLLRGALHQRAEEELLQNARMMMEAAGAARSYTTKQIAPLIEQERERYDAATNELRRVLDTLTSQRGMLEALARSAEAGRPVLAEPEFYPQSIPAYAATEVSNLFRGRYPEYGYKEACLNPTNPRDRTVDWEADVVNTFRNGSSERKELFGRRLTPTGETIFLAAPIRITNNSCLVCHSVPKNAPVEMIRRYGVNNGFGWQLNEVVGAQIVSVPVAVAKSAADGTFRGATAPLGGVFGGLWLLGNVAVLLVTRAGRVVSA